MANDDIGSGGTPHDSGYTPDNDVAAARGNLDISQRMDRYQGLAATAANRPAYQMDPTLSNAARAQAQQSRQYQGDSMALARQAANGQNLQSQRVGQQALYNGVQAQQAAAMSSRGGSLAQAAALRQQQNGQGAFMQQGNQMLDAQRAQEMAAARDQYMQQATGMRQSDQQGQDLDESFAQAQQGIDMGYHQLNDQGQMGYEHMGQDEANDAMNTQVHANAMAANAAAAQAQAEQQDKNRGVQVAAGFAGGIPIIGGGIQAGITGSDSRMKQGSYMLSDDRTKLAAAWDQGHNEALDKVQQYRQMSPAELKSLGEKGNRLANAVRGAKGDAYDEARGVSPHIMQGGLGQIPMRQPTSFTREDPMTKQLAEGLAPHSYEYKPEFAAAEGQQPGEKNVGPMAQAMASNPVTGQAVSQRPDGLLQIDMKKATKLSLAAAGHNAQKIREQQAQIDALKKGSGATHRRSAGEGMGSPQDGGDDESLGPSGEGNYDAPDYNYVKTQSPLDVATALEQKNGSISPETEAYMRRQGMWGPKTDAILQDRGLKGGR